MRVCFKIAELELLLILLAQLQSLHWSFRSIHQKFKDRNIWAWCDLHLALKTRF